MSDNVFGTVQLPLYSPSDAGNGIGEGAIPQTPAADPTPSAPPAPAIQGTPAAPVAATPIPGQAQTPATGAPGEGWVPSYRVRETREAAVREAQNQWAQREQQYQQQIDQIRSQLHSLVGVAPPQNPEVAAIKTQFSQLYPGLAKMEEKAAQLEQILERAGDLESSTEHYWQSYGRQTVDRLFNHATEALGSPLTDEGKRLLHSSFVGFVQSSPELTARYANDPTLVEDFWKVFSSGFIDPARRTAAAQVVGRAPQNLPQDTPGGAPRVPQAPAPKDLDERVGNAWAQYQSTARS